MEESVVTLIIRGFEFSAKTQDELLNYQGKYRSHILTNLAKNEHTLPSVLAKLARNESKRVRMAVAQNINTPVINLILLSGDIHLCVRKAINTYTLKNPNVPVELVEHLAKDPYWLVRKKVSDRWHTPVHILEQLATDESEFVRMGVAYNKNCPQYILDRLKNDKCDRVCHTVMTGTNY